MTGTQLMPNPNVQIGTQEKKRIAKSLPPLDRRPAWGCIWAVVVAFVILFGLYWATGSAGWLVVAAPAGLVLTAGAVSLTRDVLLLAECRRKFGPRGIRCLVVYSDSPHWKDYIVDAWLPRLGPAALTLNWSKRAEWSAMLEVRLFRRFVASRENFNPAVLVLRGLQRPAVFRFYHAFQQAKHGRARYLNALEAEMFAEVDRNSPDGP